MALAVGRVVRFLAAELATSLASSRATAGLGAGLLGLSLLGACFSGGTTFGQPCVDDAACRGGLVCSENGRCVAAETDADATQGETQTETGTGSTTGAASCVGSLDCPADQACDFESQICAPMADLLVPDECLDLPPACVDMCRKVVPCGAEYDIMLTTCRQLQDVVEPCQPHLQRLSSCMGDWACASGSFYQPQAYAQECTQMATEFGSCLKLEGCAGGSDPCQMLCEESNACSGQSISALVGRCHAAGFANPCANFGMEYFQCFGGDPCGIAEFGAPECSAPLGQLPELPGCAWLSCGDGIWLMPEEECDDSNLVSGDDCSELCMLE